MLMSGLELCVFPSLAAATHAPSGEKATEVTAPAHLPTISIRPVSKRQRRIVVSSLPQTIRSPSGAQATERTPLSHLPIISPSNFGTEPETETCPSFAFDGKLASSSS